MANFVKILRGGTGQSYLIDFFHTLHVCILVISGYHVVDGFSITSRIWLLCEQTWCHVEIISAGWSWYGFFLLLTTVTYWYELYCVAKTTCRSCCRHVLFFYLMACALSVNDNVLTSHNMAKIWYQKVILWQEFSYSSRTGGMTRCMHVGCNYGTDFFFLFCNLSNMPAKWVTSPKIYSFR